jgi:S-formylglutathione hydrolase FrmB
LDPRLSEITFHSDALADNTTVRVLLPEGYAQSSRRYPVLYLFHGGTEDYTAWTTEGDAEAATAGLPLIVVMPDAGPYGFCTDWYNNGALGLPEWPRYHIDQLIPWVDANYRTAAGRAARATAGVSLGGHCAVSYAARYPDLFGAAGSFSGAVDDNNPSQRTTMTPISGFVFGPSDTQQIRWRAVNAWDLAANLGDTDVTLFSGTGEAGGPNANGADQTETWIHQEAVALDQRLTDLGIHHTFENYGPGSHDWYYFTRDFRQWLPHLMSYFDEHDASRSVAGSGNLLTPFVYATTEPTYTQHEWSVRIRRPAPEFSALEVKRPESFSIVGSGTATVVTPAAFKPRVAYKVRLTPSAGKAVVRTAIADRRGRLRLSIALGPANPQPQYSQQAEHTGAATLAHAGAVTDVPFYRADDGSSFFRTRVAISTP